MPLTRYYILENDTTTAGGIVQTTTNPVVFNVSGKKQSCIGDDVWCPACQSMGQIVPSGPRLSFSLGGATPALNDDLCLCKCSPPPKLINSQTSFKEIIDDNQVAQYRQAQAQYRQAKLQNNLANATSTDDDLPKFTVHFRRPDDYKGEYGFDWLRDEYVYDLTYVAIQKNVVSLYSSQNKERLIGEYRTYQGANIGQLNTIVDYDDGYTPEWLSLFPNQIATLYLQIDQTEQSSSEPLMDDGTILEFKCSQGLSIELLQEKDFVSLGEIIDGAEFESLSFSFTPPSKIIEGKFVESEPKHKRFNRYISSLPVRVLCHSVFFQLGKVEVFAKKDGRLKLVGLLLVYPNAGYFSTTIHPIYVNNGANSVQMPEMIPSDFGCLISKNFLNQALVYANVKPVSFFNLVDVYRNYIKSRNFDDIGFKKLLVFLDKFYQPYSKSSLPMEFIPKSIDDSLNEKMKERGIEASIGSSDFTKELIELYEIVERKNIPVGGVYGANSKSTYLFFTEHYAYGENDIKTLGIADTEKCCQKGNQCKEWGNAVVVFNRDKIENDGEKNISQYKKGLTFTILHELGHSYGLEHTFENTNNFYRHNFYRGYTDNFMDYTNFLLPKDDGVSSGESKQSSNNPKKGEMFSLFKWQWDIIQKDKSINGGL